MWNPYNRTDMWPRGFPHNQTKVEQELLNQQKERIPMEKVGVLQSMIAVNPDTDFGQRNHFNPEKDMAIRSHYICIISIKTFNLSFPPGQVRQASNGDEA